MKDANDVAPNCEIFFTTKARSSRRVWIKNTPKFALFVYSFENNSREGFLTSFEMTTAGALIVISSGCEKSFPTLFHYPWGERKLMNQVVVNCVFATLVAVLP